MANRLAIQTADDIFRNAYQRIYEEGWCDNPIHPEYGPDMDFKRVEWEWQTLGCPLVGLAHFICVRSDV